MQLQVRSSTAIVRSPCIVVDMGGAIVTGGGWLNTGDVTLGIMGTSGTSSVVGRLLDPSLVSHSLSLWVAYICVSLL